MARISQARSLGKYFLLVDNFFGGARFFLLSSP